MARRRMSAALGRRARRIALGAAAALFVAVCVLVVWVRRPVPAASGEARVGGLHSDLEIVRDAHAIPHIYAHSVEDAYLGLGYAHAQDRLWQLEWNRRVASGRLSELVGARALDTDKLFRTLGLRRAAERAFAGLDPETQRVLDAYARGINAWLAEDHPLPLEFQLLGARPQPFAAVDSVLFIKLLAWQLSGNWFDELWRVRLASKLTAEQLAEFLPAYRGDAPIPFTQLRRAYDALGFSAHGAPQHEHTRLEPVRRNELAFARALAPLAAELSAFAPSALGHAIGSNNWAVDGSRTGSHKPLLANDPHLALTAPSYWYFAHLEAPGLSVIGATLPAAAGVILGRNAHVAWSFTNTHPDTQDLFIERLDPSDPTLYLTPEGPRAFEVERVTIQVKGAPEVTHWVRRTRHGPVLSDVHAKARALTPEGHALALSWVGLADDDTTAAFPLRAARARDAAALRQAARSFQAPTQNIVFADDAGEIGFVAAGRIPLRAQDNELKGLLPAPGWLAAYDWTGFVPFDALPQTAAPASGRIVTANQNIQPRDYAHWLGADWGPPYRHDRITQLLDARPAHSLESFAAIQRDQRSTVADQLLPVMLEALGAARDDAEQRVLTELAQWDHEMRPDAAAPLWFAAWLRELSRAVYADELGDLFVDDAWARPEFLRAVLRDEAGQGRWCDDLRTREVESCPLMVRRGFEAASAYLTRRFGSDRRAWSWGAAHPGISAHPLLGKLPVIGAWFNVTAVRGGDSSTVDVGSYHVEDDETAFHNAWGPGFRALYDLADLERSVGILNSGQSGHVTSAHYRDMNALWARGEYVPLVTERKRVERDALGTWRLRASK